MSQNPVHFVPRQFYGRFRVGLGLSRFSSTQTSQGFSLAEVLVGLLMVGVFAAITVPVVTYGQGDAADTAAIQLQSTLRTLRTLAISNTSAYRLTWASSAPKTLVTQYVDSTDCTATSGWKSVGAFSTSELTLPAKAVISSPSSVSICFDAQGYASRDLSISIRNATANTTKTVQTYLGGAIDVY